jgi:hypothetical protein
MAVSLAPLEAASGGSTKNGQSMYRHRVALPIVRPKVHKWGHRKPPSNIRLEPRRAARGGADVTAIARCRWSSDYTTPWDTIRSRAVAP